MCSYNQAAGTSGSLLVKAPGLWLWVAFSFGGGQAIPSILRDELHHAQTPRNMNGVAGLLYLRAQLPPLNLAGCLAERAEGTERCSGSRGRAPCFRISHAVHHTPQYHRQMTALQTCTFRTESGINHSANEELLFYIFTGRSELSLVSR